MLGLETALGVCLAHLDMPLADVVAALSWKPAAIAGVADQHGRPDRRRVNPPTSRVFDPADAWQVVPAELASRSRNTPFVGVALRAGCATPCPRVRRRDRRSATRVHDMHYR